MLYASVVGGETDGELLDHLDKIFILLLPQG